MDSFIFDMGMSLQSGFAVPVRLMADEEDLPAALRLLSEGTEPAA